MNLFENQNQDKKPLAYRYRPKTLEEFAGQKNIVGDKGVLKKILTKSVWENLPCFRQCLRVWQRDSGRGSHECFYHQSAELDPGNTPTTYW